MAAGSGSRLRPLTNAVSKQLLPVYDQPMIHHSLSTLILGGFTDILIIVNPEHLEAYRSLFGNGENLGIDISYLVQEKPEGIAQAFIIGESFIDKESVALILGDNIFHGNGIIGSSAAGLQSSGAKIFAYRTTSPESYGVVEFDDAMNVISIEEKPDKPKSQFAIPGLYFYDEKACEIAKSLKPSARGELEIVDLNLAYLDMDELQVEILPRGTVWMDAGTFDSLAEAGDYVRAVQRRQGIKLGCPEEASWRMGLIDDLMLIELASIAGKSRHGEYLRSLLGESL